MNLPTLDQCTVKVEALEEYDRWTDPVFGYAPEVERAFDEMVDQYGLWGWCTVKVTVTDPTGLLSESAYLGACSYKSEEDFRSNSGYFEVMCEEALAEIHRQIKALSDRYS